MSICGIACYFEINSGIVDKKQMSYRVLNLENGFNCVNIGLYISCIKKRYYPDEYYE
jgi:hypothetical protein